MNSLLSPNPEEREDAIRHLVRRLLAESREPVSGAAKTLGRSRQALEKQLAEDGDMYLRLSDLLPLVVHHIPDLLDELVRAAERPRAGNVPAIIEAIAATMSAEGDLAQTAMKALADGRIDGPEAQELGGKVSKLIAAAGRVDASVAVAVVGSKR